MKLLNSNPDLIINSNFEKINPEIQLDSLKKDPELFQIFQEWNDKKSLDIKFFKKFMEFYNSENMKNINTETDQEKIKIKFFQNILIKFMKSYNSEIYEAYKKIIKQCPKKIDAPVLVFPGPNGMIRIQGVKNNCDLLLTSITDLVHKINSHINDIQSKCYRLPDNFIILNSTKSFVDIFEKFYTYIQRDFYNGILANIGNEKTNIPKKKIIIILVIFGIIIFLLIMGIILFEKYIISGNSKKII